MKPIPFLGTLAEPTVAIGTVRMRYDAKLRMNVLFQDPSRDVASWLGTLVTETRESRDHSEIDNGTESLDCLGTTVTATSESRDTSEVDTGTLALNADSYFGTLETKTREGRDASEIDATEDLMGAAMNLGTLLTKTEEGKDQSERSLALGFFGTAKTDTSESSDPYDVE